MFIKSKTESEKQIEEINRKAFVKNKYINKPCILTACFDCTVHMCSLAKCPRVSEYTGKDYFKTYDSELIKTKRSSYNNSSSNTCNIKVSTGVVKSRTSSIISTGYSSVSDDEMRKELQMINVNRINTNKHKKSYKE
jgi:hypothetical protein